MGGRGLISIEDCVSMEIRNLHKYVSESEEPMLQAVYSENINAEGRTKDEVLQERQDSLDSKAMHSVFFKKTEFRDNTSWEWLTKGDLKKATEGTILAAQEQAIRVRAIMHRIDKSCPSPLCRLCGQRDETVAHIVAECQSLAQRQYKNWRHDVVARVLHWELCKKFKLPHNDRWYEHTPEPSAQNENAKLIWDVTIQTDKKVDHNKPDIVLIDKTSNFCLIIDVACPFDTRVIEKENEKITKYQDLKWELIKIWKVKTIRVIPIVIGALGTISKAFKEYLMTISKDIHFGTLQKACLLETARILRYALSI